MYPGRGPSSYPGSHDEFKEHHISEPRINDRIRVAEVRLVGPNGEQVGIVRVEDALRLAQDADLDLVEVAPDARPPVCKIMDYGKFKYEADMKAREARRNQTNTVLKEIRFRLKIDPHDYGTKKGHVERFLAAGDKVKVMIMFRGREQSRPEMGIRLLQRLAADVAELGFVESSPKQDGRNMIMVLGPTKKKAEQKQEQRRVEKTRPPREQPETIEFDVDAATATAAAPAPAAAPAVQAEPAAAVATPVAAATAPAPASTPVAAPAPAAAAPAPSRPSAPRPPAPASRPAASAPRPASSGARPASSGAGRPASSSRPAGSAAPASRPSSASAPRPAAAPAPAPAPRPAAATPVAAPKPSALPKPVPRPAPSGVKPAPRPAPSSSSEDAKA
ncbi:translation initiation factor IF-3 [Cellulomonas cellasea]|uniref:translation initiation factor IF-3 n=1 Tax=Cellulomonas cellasea TaxID=43670 RepID=UPI001FECCF38|nr:translation initiation factor IF-3 [Cellulomonas cellasea]